MGEMMAKRNIPMLRVAHLEGVPHVCWQEGNGAFHRAKEGKTALSGLLCKRDLPNLAGIGALGVLTFAESVKRGKAHQLTSIHT